MSELGFGKEFDSANSEGKSNQSIDNWIYLDIRSETIAGWTDWPFIRYENETVVWHQKLDLFWAFCPQHELWETELKNWKLGLPKKRELKSRTVVLLKVNFTKPRVLHLLNLQSSTFFTWDMGKKGFHPFFFTLSLNLNSQVLKVQKATLFLEMFAPFNH